MVGKGVEGVFEEGSRHEETHKRETAERGGEAVPS